MNIGACSRVSFDDSRPLIAFGLILSENAPNCVQTSVSTLWRQVLVYLLAVVCDNESASSLLIHSTHPLIRRQRLLHYYDDFHRPSLAPMYFDVYTFH